MYLKRQFVLIVYVFIISTLAGSTLQILIDFDYDANFFLFKILVTQEIQSYIVMLSHEKN